MSQEIQMVAFHTNNEQYAINITSVERIIGYSSITSLPETSDYVLGVVSYEDSILPVVDLSVRFYQKPIEYSEDSKILVIQLEDYKLGLLVDVVDEIKSIEEEAIEKPPGAVKGVAPRYIKGLIKEEENIIIYLDTKEIFKGDQEKELKDLIQDS